MWQRGTGAARCGCGDQELPDVPSLCPPGWTLTGSSCCGNGCNWPEQGGLRIQGPRRRKSVQQHPPKPGGRNNRRMGRAGGPWGWDGAGQCPREWHGHPVAWTPRGTGMGLCGHICPDLPSHLPCVPRRCPGSRGAAVGWSELIPILGSGSSSTEWCHPRSEQGWIQVSPEPAVPTLPSTALITFDENSQVLPANYPQETHCQPGEGGARHEQNQAGMRWVIQLWIYISKGTSFLWEQGPRGPGVGPEPWAGLGGCTGQEFWVLPCPDGWVGVLGRVLGAAMPRAGVPPCSHRGAQEFAPIWAQVEDNSSPGSGQGGPSDEQDEQDHVGQRGCHPHHLGGGSVTPLST